MPISIMFPFCHDRLVALEYGRILHIILSSFSKLSSEAMGLHNLETNDLFEIVGQVIDMDGMDEVGSQSYCIGIPWSIQLGLINNWR